MILAVCIIVMALDLKAISLEMTAIVGALVCVLTGCLTEKQAYSAIDLGNYFPVRRYDACFGCYG